MRQEDLALARWFTRGWTLQELIAPVKLVFFIASWESLVRRNHWSREYHKSPAFDGKALQGRSTLVFMRSTSIAQRMMWAAGR